MVMRKSWSPIKEMLFTYLALTKILYWFNTVNTIDQNGLGNMREVILRRLLNQDIFLILVVVFFYFLDERLQLKKSKYSEILEQVVFYAIGFIALLGILLAYNWIVFGFLEVDSWWIFIRNTAFAYLLTVAILNIKYYFKTKTKIEMTLFSKSDDDKRLMLRTLFDEGLLTQEEFDNKKKIITRCPNNILDVTKE